MVGSGIGESPGLAAENLVYFLSMSFVTAQTVRPAPTERKKSCPSVRRGSPSESTSLAG
jgi:hypothetical protein